MTDLAEAYERLLVPRFFVPCAEELLGLAAPAAGERASGSAREFLAAEMAATPLGGAVEPAAEDRLARELARGLAAYPDDDGVVLPMQTWLATARRR